MYISEFLELNTTPPPHLNVLLLCCELLIFPIEFLKSHAAPATTTSTDGDERKVKRILFNSGFEGCRYVELISFTISDRKGEPILTIQR